MNLLGRSRERETSSWDKPPSTPTSLSQQSTTTTTTTTPSTDQCCSSCLQALPETELQRLAFAFSLQGPALLLCKNCLRFVTHLAHVGISPASFPYPGAPLFARAKLTHPELVKRAIESRTNSPDEAVLLARLLPFMSGVGFDLARAAPLRRAAAGGAVSVFYPDAIVAIVDISGYTTLAEKLRDELGDFAVGHASGAEALVVDGLNVYFKQLIDCIHVHGGDVVKFAGDALLAVWTKPREERAGALVCAVEIAHRLTHIVSNPAGKASHELTAHVGVARGPVMGLSVGQDHRETILCGAAIQSAGEALDRAGAQSVVVTHDVLRTHFADLCACSPAARKPSLKQASKLQSMFGLDTSLEVAMAINASAEHEGDDDFYCVDHVTLPAHAAPTPLTAAAGPMFASGSDDDDAAASAAAARFMSFVCASVPRAALDRNLSSEMRSVATVFTKLHDLGYAADVGDKAASAVLQVVLCSCQAIVAKYGGEVRQLIVDDKGCVLLSAFADASRAVHTALALHRGLRVVTSSGVAFGKAFVGVVGSVGVRVDWTVSGDSVNLSARLMGLAPPGQTRCDAATAQACMSADLHFTELEAVKLKGKAHATRVFVPSVADRELSSDAAAAQSLAEGVCFGLEAEKAHVKAWLASDDEAAVLQIVGDEGAGKTSLLLWCAAQCVLGPMDPVLVSGGFDALLPAHTSRADAICAVLDACEDVGDALVQSLRALDADALAGSFDGNGRVAERDALVLLAAKARARPVLLLADDVDLWPAVDVALLQRLAFAPGVRVVSTSCKPLSALRGRRRVCAVGPLDATALGAVIAARRALAAAPADDVARALWRRSGGIPREGLRLFDAAVARGALVVQGGVCLATAADTAATAGEPFELPEPRRVLDVVDGLAPAPRAALKLCCCAFPGSVPASLVATVLEGDDDAGGALEALRAAGLVRALPPPPHGRFVVDRADVASPVYEMTSFVERAAMHVKLAEWTASAAAALPRDEALPIVAAHLKKAGRLPEALRALVKGAQEHVRLGLGASAVDLLEDAVRWIDEGAAVAAGGDDGFEASVCVSLVQLRWAMTGWTALGLTAGESDALLLRRALGAAYGETMPLGLSTLRGFARSLRRPHASAAGKGDDDGGVVMAASAMAWHGLLTRDQALLDAGLKALDAAGYAQARALASRFSPRPRLVRWAALGSRALASSLASPDALLLTAVALLCAGDRPGLCEEAAQAVIAGASDSRTLVDATGARGLHAMRLVCMARACKGDLVGARDALEGLLAALRSGLRVPHLVAWARAARSLLALKRDGAWPLAPTFLESGVAGDAMCVAEVGARNGGPFSAALRDMPSALAFWMGEALELAFYCALMDRGNTQRSSDVRLVARKLAQHATTFRHCLPTALRLRAMAEGAHAHGRRAKLALARARLAAMRFGNALELALCDSVEAALQGGGGDVGARSKPEAQRLVKLFQAWMAA